VKELFSPKQVARAISVSESSIKRWCDSGRIPTQYTAGGHRRIPIAGLIAFLKTSKYEIARPEVLGLPATAGQTDWVFERAFKQLTAALLQGDHDLTRRIILDLYLANHTLYRICDEVIAKAFFSIGDRWACGDAEVFEERRACQICTSVLHEVGLTLKAPPEYAPLAIGCTPPGDQYTIATTMAELVLREANWRAVSLGSNLPFDTMQSAIQKHKPQIFWLSVSYLCEPGLFVQAYHELLEFVGQETAIVVGGRALNRKIREQMQFSHFCDNMQHLSNFAQNNMPANPSEPAE